MPPSVLQSVLSCNHHVWRGWRFNFCSIASFGESLGGLKKLKVINEISKLRLPVGEVCCLAGLKLGEALRNVGGGRLVCDGLFPPEFVAYEGGSIEWQRCKVL